MLKLVRGTEVAGFKFDRQGTLSSDGVPLTTPDNEGAVDAKFVEIYPSPDGKLFAIVFDDEDGLYKARIYNRIARSVSKFEPVAGLEHIEWSPTSKHLMMILQYEGQFLRLYDTDRSKFSNAIDISGRGTNPQNKCVGRQPATNWAFAGNVRWNWAVWFAVDEYDAKPHIEDGVKVSTCYAEPQRDEKLREMTLLWALDGSATKIAYIIAPPRPEGVETSPARSTKH